MDKRKASWIAHADRNRGGVKKRPDFKTAPENVVAPTNPKPIGRDLPPIDFPPFAEKYLGKKVISSFRELTEMLDEYELLLLRKTLSMDEVVQYLANSGDLATIQQRIEKTFEDYQEHAQGLMVEALRLYSTEEKALKKVREATNKALDSLSLSHHRVLLGALWSDAQSAHLVEDIKNLLAEITAETPEKFLYPALAKDPMIVERLLMKRIREMGINEAHSFSMPMVFFLLRLLKQKPHPLDSDSAEDREVGDTVAEELRGKNIEPDKIPLPTPEYVPEVTRLAFVKSPGKNPLLFGSVHVYFKDPKDQRELGAWFNISRLNGDLCLPNGMLASPEDLFAENGQRELFLRLRAHVMRAVYSAVETGELKEVVDTVQEDIQKGIEEAVESEPEEELATRPEETEAELPLEAASEPKPVVEPISIEPAKKEKREKVVIKTLAWEKTKSALERLGVVVKKQGPHYKLYRKVGEEVLTCSFPNEHTKPGTLAWIVKTNLKILRISPQEFLKNLK